MNHLFYSKIGKTFIKRTLEPGFTRYILGIQYNGSNYSGYAKNNHQFKKSIEECIENAIQKFIGIDNYLNFKGSSRTDKGVHALRNVSQVDLIRKIPSKNHINQLNFNGDVNNFLGSSEDVKILKSGINYYLQQDTGIYVTDVTMTDCDFDVRGSSTSRTYMYRIITPSINSLNSIDHSKYYSRSPQSLFQNNLAWNINQVLDINAMMKASQLFLGEQDFSSFRNSKCQSISPFRNILALEIHEFNSNSIYSNCNTTSNVNTLDSLLMKDSTLITINITANAFLLKMCRNIVGILVQVGLNKLSIQDVKNIIDAKNRSLVSVRPAPAHGLYLLNVNYDIA